MKQQLHSVVPLFAARKIARTPKDEMPREIINNPAISKWIRIYGTFTANPKAITVSTIMSADTNAYIDVSTPARYKTVKFKRVRLWLGTGDTLLLSLYSPATGFATRCLQIQDMVQATGATLTNSTKQPFGAGEWGLVDQGTTVATSSNATVIDITGVLSTTAYIADFYVEMQ